MLKFYQKTNHPMPTAQAILKIARLNDQFGDRNSRKPIANPPPKKTKGQPSKGGKLRFVDTGKGHLALVID